MNSRRRVKSDVGPLITDLLKQMALKGKKSHEQTLAKSKDFQGFLDEFQKENDRSAAIMGAAFLDEHLKQLLANFMVTDISAPAPTVMTNRRQTPSAPDVQELFV